ncbi:MAG: hypothetical protein NTY38_06820 [Acidobacteria bacterium]|nr:hypothetical protein [Acidobacteriota bacterium]
MLKSSHVVLFACCSIWPTCAMAQCAPELSILSGATLASGYSIGLNTSGNRTDWLTQDGNSIIMQYPAAQAWGAVFITFGPAVPPGNRPGRDLSACQSLVLEMSGSPGTVEIGIKDSGQPDDGNETKIPVQVSSEWQTVTIPLARFTGADPKRVYVFVEFVFGGPSTQTLRVRGIKYTAAQATSAKVLPQLAFGGGWYSALYFANTSDQAQSFQVQFIGDDGRPLFIPSVGATSASVSLSPRGGAIIEAPNSGALAQGYASASLPDAVVGYGIFRQSESGRDQEAVVPLSSASATRSTLIWDDSAFSTAVAIVNPSGVNNTVAITVRDLLGTVLGTSSVSLAAGAKTAVLLRDLPGLSTMVGKRGTAEFSANSGRVAVLGLRFGAQSFTSIPTADK